MASPPPSVLLISCRSQQLLGRGSIQCHWRELRQWRTTWPRNSSRGPLAGPHHLHLRGVFSLKRRVIHVLQRLCEHGLYPKAEKCELHKVELSFLSYHIGPPGVAMETTKVAVVLQWPESRSTMELQCFLGFANFYHRVICNFSSVTVPLSDLLKLAKQKAITLNPEAWGTFKHLKGVFTSAPILKLPVLSQRHGKPEKLSP